MFDGFFIPFWSLLIVSDNQGYDFVVRWTILIINDMVKTMPNSLNHNPLTIKIDGSTFSHVINAKRKEIKLVVRPEVLGM